MLKGRISLSLLLGVLALMAVLALNTSLRRQALAPGQEYDVDVFYHVTMADLFPGPCIQKQFPWAQLSLWKDRFVDKELGFHALLASLRRWGGLVGAGVEPPFHFLQGALFALVLLAFTLLPLWLFGARHVYWIPPLFLVVSPLLVLRLNMVRPHLLSMMLFGAALLLVVRVEAWRAKCATLAGIGFAYAWCYSSPHLLLVPVAAYLAASFCPIVRQAWTSPDTVCGNTCTPDSGGGLRLPFRQASALTMAAVGGVVAGLTLHPQFPNTFVAWYTQGVLVGRQIMGADFGVGLGLELLAPTPQTVAENVGVLLLLVVNFLLLLAAESRSLVTVTCFLAQFVMTLGFFASERCIEYAVPAGVLCFVFALEQSPRPEVAARLRYWLALPGWCRVLAGVLLALVCLVTAAPRNRAMLNQARFRACSQFGEWARRELPPQTYVGQIRWGEFPRLFYAAPELYYSMAMDPMFTYIVYPDKIRRLEAFRQVRQPLTPVELRDILGTRLVFVGAYDPLPGDHLLGSGCKVLYRGPDGRLFLLPPVAPCIE